MFIHTGIFQKHIKKRYNFFLFNLLASLSVINVNSFDL